MLIQLLLAILPMTDSMWLSAGQTKSACKLMRLFFFSSGAVVALGCDSGNSTSVPSASTAGGSVSVLGEEDAGSALRAIVILANQFSILYSV